MAGHANYRVTLDMYVGITAGILAFARAATEYWLVSACRIVERVMDTEQTNDASPTKAQRLVNRAWWARLQR